MNRLNVLWVTGREVFPVREAAKQIEYLAASAGFTNALKLVSAPTPLKA